MNSERKPGFIARVFRRPARLALICAVTLGVPLAGLWWFTRAEQFYTDAETIRQPIASISPREVLWQPPAPLRDLVGALPDEPATASGQTYEPRLSWDGSTMYLVRGKAGGSADIYWSRRTPSGWSTPQSLDEINTGYDELGPEPSADGTALYFYSDRPGGSGGYDIWVALRREAPANVFEATAADAEFDSTGPTWQTPINLGPALNSEFNDYGPALTRDGVRLYFSSNRPQPGDSRQPNPQAWPATVREEMFHRSYDLYTSRRADNGWQSAEPLALLNTPANEGAACVSPSGDFLYFASDRPGGLGGFDLYRARRIADGFAAPQNLGPPVNTADHELDPGLAQLGFALYFSSDRPADTTSGERMTASQPLPRPYGLYYTASREVFRESQARDIDWAALWNRIGPNLLWLLLGLLSLLLLLLFLRDMRNRKLSLLVRCLLASLATHCLILMLTSFWKVASGIGDMVQAGGGGSIQVSIASTGRGDGIVQQIRGGLTEVTAPDTVAITTPAPTAALEIRPETTLATLGMPRIEIAPALPAAIETADREAPTRRIERERERTAPPPDSASLSVAMPTESARVDSQESARALPAAATPEARGAPAFSDDATEDAIETVAVAPQRTPVAPMNGSSIVATDVATDARVSPSNRGSSRRETSPLPDDAAIVLAVPADAAGASDGEAAPAGTAASVTPVAADGDRRGESLIASSQPAVDSEIVRVDPERVGVAGKAWSPSTTIEAATNVPDAAPDRSARPTPAGVSGSGAAPRELALAVPAEAAKPSDRAGSGDEAASSTSVAAIPAAEVGVARRAPGDLSGSGTLQTSRIDVAPGRTAADALPIAALGSGNVATDTRDAVVPSRKPAESGRDTGGAPGVDIASIPLGLPTDLGGSTGDFSQRSEDQRSRFIDRMGGSAETEAAVARALAWLARHQSRDGHWDAVDFDDGCGECAGAAEQDVDIATTGLALLAFLGAGHTHTKDGLYRDAVQRGLAWLISRVDRNGDIRNGETLYSQGIATIALAEAYGMTRDSALRPVVSRAVRFIVASDDKRAGGWRYQPGEPGDTSVLGWQVMALRSAKSAGIEVPEESFDSARRWLALVSSRTRPGLFSYRPREKFTQAMTAEGTFVRQLLGDRRDDASMKTAIEYIARPLPDWDRRLNTYSWYYITLALFHHGGSEWQSWNQALSRELVKHQRRGGKAEGSWDPGGEWAPVGGRIYQTAICALMLEVYYRYLPIYTLDGAPAAVGGPALGDYAYVSDAVPVGGLRGRVTDAETGEPIIGAMVRLDLEGDSPPTAESDADGAYKLSVPRVPDFIAVTASHEGYTPAARNVPGERLFGGASLQVDFKLRKIEADLIALEAEPDVHHLGNDKFEGAINSQFQKRSEGAAWRTGFELPAGRIPPPGSMIEITFLAKGVQCPLRIWINDVELEDRPDRSPRDGSFAELRARFDAGLLQEGANTFEIRDTNCTGDLDDFEFVNVQIRLRPID